MTDEPNAAEQTGDQRVQGLAGQTDDGRVYLVTPDAMAVEGPRDAEVETDDDQARSVTDMVEQPAKVMRIGNMVRTLLAEEWQLDPDPGPSTQERSQQIPSSAGENSAGTAETPGPVTTPAGPTGPEKDQ